MKCMRKNLAMTMLIDMIDASEAREDDENFKNAVDLLFEELEDLIPQLCYRKIMRTTRECLPGK